MANKTLLVFVHGWSVTDTDTYGGLPERLKNEAAEAGLSIEIKNIFLGRYISFHDEVKVTDISNAFAAALQDEVLPLLKNKLRFVCITHSTGGPVVRDWWHRFYLNHKNNGQCPMSHLIMLAPANYGSALAQLGKGRLSRLKFWFGGIEPGQGVLDWLELGSQESWCLNKSWFDTKDNQISIKGVFPFVLAGQSIDRAFYDNLNTYTGESGSDGVVRVASANLQGQHVLLKQQDLQKSSSLISKGSAKKKTIWTAEKLIVKAVSHSPATALRIIAGKSHSGKKMGIMRSVKSALTDNKNRATVETILSCIKVKTKTDYKKLIKQFEKDNAEIQSREKVEIVKHLLYSDNYFIQDRYSMLVFRVFDQEGYPVKDYDLILTAGESNDPNHLPRGFCVDKQRNSKSTETISYYLNHDIMKGVKAICDDKGAVIRPAIVGAKRLGFKILPRPDKGFVHYLPCEIEASEAMLEKVVQANSTSLIEIHLQRIVHKNVMRLDKGIQQKSFEVTQPGDDVV